MPHRGGAGVQRPDHQDRHRRRCTRARTRYFRVIASDVQQGEIDAYVAAKVLNATKVYVIDDQEAYGRGLALIFKKAYTTTDGGTVVGSASLPGSTTTFATQISNAQSEGAQAIFFGGTTGNGCGLVRRDMGKAGLNIPLLGGDGCQDTKFITDANSGSNTTEAVGSYATSAPDVTKLSSSATFFSQYAALTRASGAVQRRDEGALHRVRLRRDEHPAPGHPGGARRQRRPAAVRAPRPSVTRSSPSCTTPRTTARSVTPPSTPTVTRPTPGSPCTRSRAAAWAGDGTYAVDTSGNVTVEELSRHV